MSQITRSVPGGPFDSTSVVETVSGFPRGDRAVDAAFLARMNACFYRDGISGEDSFVCSPGGGMNLAVSAGVGWIRGYMAWQQESVSYTLTAGSVNTLILRLNSPARTFSLIIDTNAPVTPLVTDGIKDLYLARITVPESAVSVTSAMITDLRADTTVCGFITSVIDVLDHVGTADNALSLGGTAASGYLKRSGGTMTGLLRAASETTGQSAVRNISYGTTVPATLADGELFVLIADGGRS